jgi:hypothetical protein
LIERYSGVCGDFRLKLLPALTNQKSKFSKVATMVSNFQSFFRYTTTNQSNTQLNLQLFPQFSSPKLQSFKNIPNQFSQVIAGAEKINHPHS